MTNKTKYHGKNILIDIAYNFFSSSRILECHVEYFISINHTKSVLLTEENEHVNFQNFKRLTIAPFIIMPFITIPLLVTIPPLFMNEKDHDNFIDSIKCSIFKNNMKKVK